MNMVNTTPDVITSSECLQSGLSISDAKHIKGCSEYKLQFFPMHQPKGALHTVVGIQGSGKTKWRKLISDHFSKNNLPYDVISPDDIRTDILKGKGLTDDEIASFLSFGADSELENETWREVRLQLNRCLSDRKQCIFDATNTRAENQYNKGRDEFFDIAKEHNKVPIYVTVLNINPEAAIYRDSQRKRSVGRNIIINTYNALKNDYTKLFDSRISYRNLGDDAQFNVAEIDVRISEEECKKMGSINPIDHTCDIYTVNKLSIEQKMRL